MLLARIQLAQQLSGLLRDRPAVRVRRERPEQRARFGNPMRSGVEPAELEVEVGAPAETARALERGERRVRLTRACERAAEPEPGRWRALVERDGASESALRLAGHARRKCDAASIELHARI